MADFVALAEARFPGLPVEFLNLWTQYYANSSFSETQNSDISNS